MREWIAYDTEDAKYICPICDRIFKGTELKRITWGGWDSPVEYSGMCPKCKNTSIDEEDLVKKCKICGGDLAYSSKAADSSRIRWFHMDEDELCVKCQETIDIFFGNLVEEMDEGYCSGDNLENAIVDYLEKEYKHE